MRVGISLTSNHPDVKDPRQGARWMIERAAAARRAALDSLFVGDQHVSATPYYQNTPMLGRLLAEWGEAPAGCLFLLKVKPIKLRVPEARTLPRFWPIKPLRTPQTSAARH
jgi:hypothetical protein